MPLCGFAAGLGKLDVNSGLGEPLRAEVELLSVTPEELSTLVAAIASEEAYAVQGLTRLGVYNNIKVELAKNADGSPVLKLRSSQPVSEPYLDMLIQVDWASGRLLREYTVLLDPPGYKETLNETSLAPVTSPSVVSKPSVKTNSTASQQTATKSTQSIKNSEALDKVDAASGAEELTTKRGDTLAAIAKQMQVEGVSLDQMLVGLFENNKRAFVDGNMNRLKVGQIIKAPSIENLTTINPSQARQTIKVHSANWNEYRNSLAGTVAATPAAEEDEQKQSASGKIATAEDKAAPVQAAAQDVVRLSAGVKDDSIAGGDGGKGLDAKILALQEEATAREQALKESMDRTAALEKQISDMQNLLELKNQAMSELQQNSATAATVENTPTAVNPAISAPEAKTSTPVVKAPVEVAPQPEPSMVEGLLADVDMSLLGGAAGITLLGAGWLFMRNKRRKGLDSFERGILTSGGLRANTVFGNTTGSSSSTSDTSFLTDFAQSADGSMIDTNDVDPIAEAEVYMAYGRDAQAEEILKDAISKEPKRYELHLKLLEMYSGRKDRSAFEAIAGELYTTLGANDPVWAKVAELGASVEPENPLYDLSKTGTPNATESAAESEKLDASDFADVAIAGDEGLDFPLGNEPDSSVQNADDAASSIDMQDFPAVDNFEQADSFELGNIDDAPSGDDFAENKQANDASEAAAVTDNSLDFDLSEFSFPQEMADEKAEASSAIQFTNSADENQLPALELHVAEAKQNGDDSGFDLQFDLPGAEAEVAPESVPEIAFNEISGISFDLEAPAAPMQAATDDVESKAEEFTFEFPASIDLQAENAEDTAFSVSAEPLSNDSGSNDLGANEFDFSGINLDLADDEPAKDIAASATWAEGSAEPTESENQDVDVKLDLVAAYVDMDDKEGARELLAEVIKEGGPQQRLRAEQILGTLA